MKTHSLPDERKAVSQEAWGLAVKLADQRLQFMIQKKQQTKSRFGKLRSRLCQERASGLKWLKQ